MGQLGDALKPHLASLTNTAGRKDAVRAGAGRTSFPPPRYPRGTCPDLRAPSTPFFSPGPRRGLGGRRGDPREARVVLKGQLRAEGRGRGWGDRPDGDRVGGRRGSKKNRAGEGERGREREKRGQGLKSAGTGTGTGQETERDRRRAGTGEGVGTGPRPNRRDRKRAGGEREREGRRRAALRLGCRGGLGMAGRQRRPRRRQTRQYRAAPAAPGEPGTARWRRAALSAAGPRRARPPRAAGALQAPRGWGDPGTAGEGVLGMPGHPHRHPARSPLPSVPRAFLRPGDAA